MTIGSILRGRDNAVVAIDPELTLSALVELLAGHRIGAVPVVQADTVVGIMSERDVVHALRDNGAAALDSPIRTLMTAPAITVPPDLTILAGLSLMTRRRIRHLPVVESGRMIGFVSIGDLVKARIDRIEAEAEAMRTYIAG